MSAFAFSSAWRGRPRPVATPTLFSLVTVAGLLVIALLLPDERTDHAAAATQVARVVISPVKPQRTASLRDRLAVGLQARLDSELEFVELIAQRVRTGDLPQRLVDETFFWARQRAAAGRRGRPRRPIILFEPALRARAERLNVDL